MSNGVCGSQFKNNNPYTHFVRKLDGANEKT